MSRLEEDFERCPSWLIADRERCAALIQSLSRLVTACELSKQGFDADAEVARATAAGREALTKHTAPKPEAIHPSAGYQSPAADG